MNGIALVVALAALGVDYQVETTADKLQQYTIQIEPEILKLVAGGEEIHSEVPFEAGHVQRLCIRIGMSKTPHTPTGEAAFRQLLVSGSRYASADRTLPADTPPTILWPSRANPEPTYGLRFGYQPDANGKQAYFVQIDPAVLRTLAAGDEIYCPIDPAAGQLDRFVVSTSDKKPAPPRIPSAQTQPMAGGQTPFQAGGQTTLSMLPAESGRSQFPAATTGGFNPNLQTPAGRTNDYGPLPPAEPPLGGGFGASGFGAGNTANNNGYAAQSPRLNTPSTTLPPATLPQTNELRPGNFSPSTSGGYGQQPAAQQAPASGNYGTYGTYGTNGGNQQQLPNSNYGTYGTNGTNGGYQQPPQQQNSGYAAAPDRLATLPPPLATLPPVTQTGSQTVPPGNNAAANTTLSPQKETWGIFVVVLFALFFSIGGNLYLAWTALEFHNRYRNAIDRLRSAARSA
jgi:hypothetical protein